MYGLKRMLEIQKERKEKAAERQRRREQKQKEKEEKAAERKKLREKKKKEKERVHKKEMRRRKYIRWRQANYRRACKAWNLKRRKMREKYRKSIGDEAGQYLVIITKDRRRLGCMGIRKWKSTAYQLYNESIEMNDKDVRLPIKTIEREHIRKCDYRRHNANYEILLVKSVPIEDVGKGVTMVRNDNGKYIEVWDSEKRHYRNRRYIILERHNWKVRESFFLYGYHPIRDRKDYEFIYDKLIKEQTDKKAERTVLIYGNKLIVKYFEDFDFVVCDDNSMAVEMYNTMMKDADREKLRHVFFAGIVRSRSSAAKWIQQIREKTGWTIYAIKHS